MTNTAKTKLLNPKKVKMSKLKIYTLLTVGAFLGAFSSYFFVIAAGIYAPGLAGLSNGISYTINDIIWWQTGWINPAVGEISRTTMDAIVYWIVYWLFNIPIIYFAIRWFSKRFMTYSIYFLAWNFTFSMIFAWTPGLKEGLVNLSDPSVTEAVRTISILFFSFLGGCTSGIAVGLAFKVGGCTMGLDPVAKQISRTKDMNVSSILSIMTIISTTTFTVVRGFLPSTIGADGFESAIAHDGFLQATVFAPEYIGSWIFVGAYSAVSGAIYSSSKKVEIFATSEKSGEISEYFNSVSYHRGHTIYSLEGGYSHKEKRAIKMIVNFDEMYDVVERIAALDSKAFITVKELYRVYDIHNWTPMTEDDKEKERARLVKETKKRDKASQLNNEKKNK